MFIRQSKEEPMKIYYLKQKALASLQHDISENVYHYQSESSWIDQYFTGKNASKYYFDTGLDVDEYQLIIGGPETDFQNAKILFEAYKDQLKPVQASDPRLWTYLSHVQHWDYMLNRWKIDAADKSLKEKAESRIKSRYFLGDSKSKSFVRQGIARLYWGAYLTYDGNSENPYEYTEFFFNKQDIFTSITERSYARNKILILAALKELKKHSDLSRDDIRLFLARLNQAGAITVLDFLNEDQAGELCSAVMDEVLHVPVLKEGSSFEAYHILTGKPYGLSFTITDGKAFVSGKLRRTDPSILVGKKEGFKFSIAGQNYEIKNIH